MERFCVETTSSGALVQQRSGAVEAGAPWNIYDQAVASRGDDTRGASAETRRRDFCFRFLASMAPVEYASGSPQQVMSHGMPRLVLTCYPMPVMDSGVGLGGAADDEDSASYERRQEVKRVVSRIDPQWADLFDRGADAIARAPWLQRRLADVLAIAAKFLTHR